MRRPHFGTVKAAFRKAAFILVLGLQGATAQQAGMDEEWLALRREATAAVFRGAYTESAAPAEQALALAQRVFGPQHPNTLVTMTELARAYAGQGRDAEAERLHVQALDGRRTVLGPRHPDTLASIDELAWFYRFQSRDAEAEPLLREAFESRREALGPRHPSTLTNMDSLAQVYAGQGRGADAERLAGEALRLRSGALAVLREALGPHHPSSLASLDELTSALAGHGRNGEAEPLLREALHLRREALGPRHPSTLTSMSSLAVAYTVQGRDAEAEPLLREALDLRREALGPGDLDTLASMSHLALVIERQGRYAEAEPLRREALELRREALGPRHPDTLASMSALADIYLRQGRYSDAEPLFRQALELRREVLGPRHPATLESMERLASWSSERGRFDDAVDLHRMALDLRREALGPRHPDTLLSMNNLAYTYLSLGRAGEAEALFRETLSLMRDAFGPRDIRTLVAMNNLAAVYLGQNRFAEAETLHREALSTRREVFGPHHPETLTSTGNLGAVYLLSFRPREAEPLLREAWEGYRQALGPHNPMTLTAMYNLALAYTHQGRHEEAEPLLRDVLEQRGLVLGPNHPVTLASAVPLAGLYMNQGRHDRAELLFRDAVGAAQHALDPAHPVALGVRLGWATSLAALGRAGEASAALLAAEPQLLTRLGAEISSSGTAARNRLAFGQAVYLNTALSLALLPGADSGAAQVAASGIVRLKGIQSEEEAALARLVHRSDSPIVRDKAAKVAALRREIVALYQADERSDELAAMAQRLDDEELALGKVSRSFQQQLEVGRSNIRDIQASLTGLSKRSALLEYRGYQPVDFRTGQIGEPRWAGLLVTTDDVRVIDLGPARDTEATIQALASDLEGTKAKQAAHKLYGQLFAPMAADIAKLERLYVAPDGLLNLVPFSALREPDERRLVEGTLELRILQTGRDLLRRPVGEHLARGLLALGAIDFDASEAVTSPREPASTTAEASAPRTSAGTALSETSWVDPKELLTRTAVALDRNFAALPATGEEVRTVAELYKLFRRDEPVELWTEAKAGEKRLRALQLPPRVLHLATHGFYRPASEPQDRPLLLSGVALAGANPALRDPALDGVLHAIEAQDLNLQGTELVVLSACETAQGQMDYGEGVSGLVRALRTAGARYVLVTLRPVSDAGAAEFMEIFYRHWLGQTLSDPAAALRAAQAEQITAQERSGRDGDTWAHFVLVGG